MDRASFYEQEYNSYKAEYNILGGYNNGIK